MHRFIGGFLPLRIAESDTSGSVYSAWCPPDVDVWLLHNARSALNALWVALAPPIVWLPAYICPEVARSIPVGCDTAYYPLDGNLQPDISYLHAHVSPGDHVVAIDYFGRPANPDFVEYVDSRSDVRWVQDCAHALDGAAQAWGDWLLYSPRKIIGAPDGGVLVANRSRLPRVDAKPLADLSFLIPSIERLEDREEERNSEWYAKYVESESHLRVDKHRISAISLSVLKQTSIAADRSSRRQNYEYLRERLGEWGFFGEGRIGFTPSGFPVRTRDASKVSALLAAEGIFAPRHWASLPSDRSEFSVEHGLAQTLLTLPCDYRYDVEDMRKVAEVGRQILNSGHV